DILRPLRRLAQASGHAGDERDRRLLWAPRGGAGGWRDAGKAVAWSTIRLIQRYAVAMPGFKFARVVKEIRRDVLAARDRDPAARGVAPAEILATWPGIHALLAYRVAHALHL